MIIYQIENRQEQVIKSFATQKKALEFAVNYLKEHIADYNAKGCYPVLFEKDLHYYKERLDAVGTRYASKPDKVFFGRILRIFPRER